MSSPFATRKNFDFFRSEKRRNVLAILSIFAIVKILLKVKGENGNNNEKSPKIVATRMKRPLPLDA
jgi:hypothetical protein